MQYCTQRRIGQYLGSQNSRLRIMKGGSTPVPTIMVLQLLRACSSNDAAQTQGLAGVSGRRGPHEGRDKSLALTLADNPPLRQFFYLRYSNNLNCLLSCLGARAGPNTLRPPSAELIRCS